MGVAANDVTCEAADVAAFLRELVNENDSIPAAVDEGGPWPLDTERPVSTSDGLVCETVLTIRLANGQRFTVTVLDAGKEGGR